MLTFINRCRSQLAPRARTFRTGVILAVACAGLAAAGCGSSGSSSSGSNSPASGSSGPAVSGTASVAYAGSLQDLDEKSIGPGFTKATGYQYSGRGGGSVAVAQEIAAGEITPNVFESIGAKPIKMLEPRFTSWYIQFAASPIVLAYNPQSKYASELKAYADGSKPISGLFTLLETPGFRLGRTDPNIDPQGAAFIEMLELAQKQYHLPAGTVEKILGGPPSSASSPEIFDETALEPRLQAGQLDAASAFLSQAVQLHLSYIPLPDTIDFGNPAMAAHYATASLKLANGTVSTGGPLVVDVTTIGKPTKAAEAFIAYLLSKTGLALHKAAGYTLLTPTIVGKASAVPAAVRSELSG